MSRRWFLSAATGVLILAILLASGCFGEVVGGAQQPTAETSKPKPVIESVVGASSGMDDNYYAILDITVNNEGADGTILVTGIITQGNNKSSSDMIASIKRNEKQVIRLVIPLKWEGGDWTPSAQVRVP